MSDNQAYITLMGRSGWAVVNSFHASIIETQYRPAKIHLVYESQYSDAIQPVIQGLETIQSSYTTPNVSRVEVPDWDSRAAGNATRELVRKLKQEQFRIALDITGGRKALVTGSLLALRDEKFEHVFYLAIDTTEGAAKPYLMIPKRIQRLFDIAANEIQTEKATFDPKNQNTDVYLTRECMMVVLNQAYTRGEKIVVKAPLVGVDLLEIDLQEPKVTMKTHRSDYEQKASENEYEGSDHPDYSGFRRCLCYCGLLEYENEADFCDLLVEDFGKGYDPNRRMRRSFVSLDSNMFYEGLPTKLAKLEEHLEIPPKDVLCVTPYAVRTEVQKKITAKYRKNALQVAKAHYRAVHLDGLVDQFVGQNTLRTRTAKMARSQFTQFSKRPVHLMTGDEDESLPKDSEKVDPIIIRTLEQFAREHDSRVNFVSADKNMYDHCELAKDVYPTILTLPAKIPRTFKATDKSLVDLLFGLSLMYGVVELERIGYLFGEYRGKRSQIYMDEAKLQVRNLHRAKVLQDRVDICGKLKQLNIAR